MTRRRKILIFAAAVPMLLLMIALLYLNFADLSGWRDTVAGLASDAIGRELRIDGEFQPEIGFTTRVVATDITLANADWSDDPQMVSVERLAGEIDLLSIFFGPITIGDVDITGARVLFESDEEGRFNWALGSGEPSDASSDDGGGRVELVIGHASLKDIQLAYKPQQGRTLEAALSNLEFTDDGTGMLDLDLGGNFNDTPIEISGRLGTFVGIINAARVEHDLTGRFADGEFALQGSIEDLSSLSGVEGNASATGPALSDITTVLGLDPIFDHSFTVEASVKPAAGGSDVILDASVGEMSAKITGTVDSLVKPGALDVTIDASGPDVATIATILGADEIPGKPFAISGRVLWAGFPLTCDNVEVRVGDNTLTAHGVLGKPPLMMGTDFSFNGGGPDISAVAALAGLEVPRESYAVDGRLVRLEHGIGVEKVVLEVGGITVEADGKVGDPPEYEGTALSFRGEGPNLARLDHFVGVDLPAEPFSIGGDLAQGDGAIELDEIRARVGDNSLQASGKLSTEDGFVGTDLTVKAHGPDASHLGALADLETVPAESFSVEGRIQVLTTGYRIRNAVASLGSMNATADGLIATSPKLVGSDLQIHFEDSDLSHPASIAGISGLPHDMFSVDTRIRIEESGYRLDGFEAAVGDMALEIDGQIGAPPELEGTQIHITARGPKLSSLNQYLGQTGLPPAPFSVSGNAHIIGGAYALDSVLAEVDGNRVTLAGTVHPTKGLVGTDVEIEISVPNLGRAGDLAAGFVDMPELPETPLNLTTLLVIGESGYEVDNLRATLANARVAIGGHVGPPPRFDGTDLTVEGDGPDASLFKAILGVTIPVAPFQLNGRVERHDAGFRFHGVTARLGEYRAAIDGSLGELPKLIGTDFEIHASGPSTGLIKELAGLPWLPDRPFTLDGGFSGTPERFLTRDFRLDFGPSDIEGSFTVDITGKPDVQARLTSNVISLSRFQERLEEQDLDSSEVVEENTPPTDGKTLLIPDEPLTLDWMNAVDADVAIRVNKLILSAMVFHDLKVDLELEDARLEIERLAAVGEGKGRMDGTLTLEPAEGGYRLETELSARQLHLNVEGPEIDRAAQPPIDIDIDLKTVGGTPHELADSANGFMQLVIGKGVMDSRVLDLITADILITLLNSFNPFAKQDAATELQCGVALLSFEDGLATLEPMAFQSDKMTLLGDGKIDLGTEKLNLEWITKPRKGIGISASMITNPYIRLGGTLAQPSVELKPLEAVTSTGVAVATMGISLVAKGMYDRVTAEKKVCKKALEEIGRRTDGSLNRSGRK